MENNNAINLMKIAVNELRKQKIILPGITTIEKLVNQARIQADDTIIEMINKALTKEQKLRMDMLISGKDEESITSLGWLRSATGYPSSKTFIGVIEKLEEIRALKLNINIQGLHPNRIRQLSRLGSKYEPHSFRRFDEDKRYAILAVCLYELSQSPS